MAYEKAFYFDLLNEARSDRQCERRSFAKTAQDDRGEQGGVSRKVFLPPRLKRRLLFQGLPIIEMKTDRVWEGRHTPFYKSNKNTIIKMWKRR